MIALAMFYKHVIRYIKQAGYLNAQILKRSSDIRKVTDEGRGYTNKIADISETKNSKRDEMCIK